jgi:hypothetical protein
LLSWLAENIFFQEKKKKCFSDEKKTGQSLRGAIPCDRNMIFVLVSLEKNEINFFLKSGKKETSALVTKHVFWGCKHGRPEFRRVPTALKLGSML